VSQLVATSQPSPKPPKRGNFLFIPVILAATITTPVALHGQGASPLPPSSKTGKGLYESACAACHGANGKGMAQTTVGFETPLPDFTDCSFSSREPDADWETVILEGGPVRAFSETMPAFGDALTLAQVQGVVDYLRTFCRNSAWPRGDLNLPRPLFIEKAFPEDEAVWTTAVAIEGPGAVTNTFVYEKRIGARNQFEVSVPWTISDSGIGWAGGLGDIALGFKRALFHDVELGTIFSAGGEIVFPTGSQSRGFGKGVTVFEPFVAFGKILPSESFAHFQGGFEVPAEDLEQEIFWRFALGRTFAQDDFGRNWTPMLEVLGARELSSSARNNWDVVPQVQVTLSKRQHIMLNIGSRIPISNTAQRGAQIVFYLLWDWFDGGLWDGW
jgi:mono/diheme cytochrome c family protein